MSSAGSASSLFGDPRSVLIVDVGRDTLSNRLNPITEVDPDTTSFSQLLRGLRPYHVPPESSRKPPLS